MTLNTPELTQRFELHSNATDRSYVINLFRPISLPYADPHLSNCPIVFFLDGAITFGSAIDGAALRMAVGQLCPAVIVGISYDVDLISMIHTRTFDLSPPGPDIVDPVLAAMVGTDHGGADKFLDFMLGELTQEICSRAPEASATRKVLFGHSLAGLFAVHALLTRPQEFEVFFANSPALWWNGFAVLDLLDEFKTKLARHSAHPRVHISVAEREQDDPKIAPPGMDLDAARALVRSARMVDAARELAQELSKFELDNVRFFCFAQEEHGSVIPAAVARCLTYALTPQHKHDVTAQ